MDCFNGLMIIFSNSAILILEILHRIYQLYPPRRNKNLIGIRVLYTYDEPREKKRHSSNPHAPNSSCKAPSVPSPPTNGTRTQLKRPQIQLQKLIKIRSLALRKGPLDHETLPGKNEKQKTKAHNLPSTSNYTTLSPRQKKPLQR